MSHYRSQNPVVNSVCSHSLKKFSCTLDDIYCSPSWSGTGGGVGFVFDEKDIKNKKLDERLTLHFVLCAPNLFGRSKDIIALNKFLAPDDHCTPYMVKSYRKRLRLAGLIHRRVRRYSKKKSCIINTGTLSTFKSKYPISQLDFKEDYSTIILMYRQCSCVALLNNPHVYLKSPFLIEYLNQCILLHKDSSELCTFEHQNSTSNASLNNPKGTSREDRSSNMNYFKARFIVVKILAMLRNEGHQTFVPSYWMNDASVCVLKYFKSMCLKLLRNGNPRCNTLLRRVDLHYGPLYAIWLRNALAAFRLLVSNDKFRTGRGRPRVKVRTVSDVVNFSVASRVVNILYKFIRVGKSRWINAKNVFLIDIKRNISYYVYEQLNFIKSSRVFSFLSSSFAVFNLLLRKSLCSFHEFIF